MKRVVLASIALLTAFLFPSVYDFSLSGGLPTAIASPSLSGAIPTNVPNWDFVGGGTGLVGTPATNHDLEDGPTAVGSPPSNHNYETGDFTGWTLTGSPSVEPSGPSGYYAQLTNSERIDSAAFTVDNTAQQFFLNAASNAAAAHQFSVSVCTGMTYNNCLGQSFTCTTSCTTDWSVRTLDAIAYRGQSVKIRVQATSGTTVNVDNVVTQQVPLPGWTPTEGRGWQLKSGDGDGQYVEIRRFGELTTSSFTVENNAHTITIDAREPVGQNVSLVVLHGIGFGDETTIGSVGFESDWTTEYHDIQEFIGQTIKLKFVPSSSSGNVGVTQIDNVGLQMNDLWGWYRDDDEPMYVHFSRSSPYLRRVGHIWSDPFTVDFPTQLPAKRATYFEITYRFGEGCWEGGPPEFAAQQLDPPEGGEELEVYFGAAEEEYLVFEATYDPEAEDPPYWCTWNTSTFAVSNPTDETSAAPATSFFDVHGTGLVDVMLIKRVDDPAAVRAKEISVDTNDPVDVVTGMFHHAKTDLSLPAVGLPLEFTRTYSTIVTPVDGSWSPLGYRWRHNWESSLEELPEGAVRITMPKGADVVFGYDGVNYLPPAGSEATLEESMGEWLLVTPDQFTYAFDATGALTTITDRNGNETHLSYDESGWLTKVSTTHPDASWS